MFLLFSLYTKKKKKIMYIFFLYNNLNFYSAAFRFLQQPCNRYVECPSKYLHLPVARNIFPGIQFFKLDLRKLQHISDIVRGNIVLICVFFDIMPKASYFCFCNYRFRILKDFPHPAPFLVLKQIPDHVHSHDPCKYIPDNNSLCFLLHIYSPVSFSDMTEWGVSSYKKAGAYPAL